MISQPPPSLPTYKYFWIFLKEKYHKKKKKKKVHISGPRPPLSLIHIGRPLPPPYPQNVDKSIFLFVTPSLTDVEEKLKDSVPPTCGILFNNFSSNHMA